jgi:uncharacterized protein (DUF58 family)
MFSTYRRLNNQIKARFRSLFRTAKSVNNVATLQARQIYILPTRWSIFYGLMLLALLIGAINYTLSLAYLVTFLLAALANVAMLHTWRNLAYLEVSVINAQTVFAGDIAKINIQIRELKNRPRHAIYALFLNNATSVVSSLSADESSHLTLTLNTTQRGYVNVPRMKLYTEFPLNLFHAWALVDSTFQLLVYPSPGTNTIVMPSTLDIDAQGDKATKVGDEDFIGHKTYQVGDLPSKVDWKASSRGIGMFSKQYSNEAGSTLYLDWSHTTGDIETRISQLTRLVIDANTAQLTYGLALDNHVRIAPDHSTAHYHACLKALALR